MKQLYPSLRTGLHSRRVRLTWAAVLVLSDRAQEVVAQRSSDGSG
jgi:hypothetical protein